MSAPVREPRGGMLRILERVNFNGADDTQIEELARVALHGMPDAPASKA